MRHSTLLLTKSEQNVNIIPFLCVIRAKSTKITQEGVVVYPSTFPRGCACYFTLHWASMLNIFVYSKTCVQQEEDSLYQQIGLKFEEETSKMLHLEHDFLSC